MIHVKAGSVFDEKCDLLILPCNSNGGVTSWVRREIIENKLPFSNKPVPYGFVVFNETHAHYKKCDYVGYAASVDSHTVSADLDIIETILIEVLHYADLKSCSIINLPVLGTGAGGLRHEDVIKVYERVFSEAGLTVNIYIPDVNLARAFIQDSEKKNSNSIVIESPRVFISYAWTDIEIKNWAFELAHKLCQNGVNARLDRFHLKPGMDMPQWMTNEIIKADKVLLICDKHYSEKADTRKAGVGWETMLIQGDILLQGDVNTKYISVACGDFEKNTPIYMKSKLGIRKEDVDKDISVLLEHLFDIDVAPEIGEIPDWIKEKVKIRA
ncbi:TIR domain-containing protein [Vibrio splendidus]